jgi:hypothetical protein
VYESVTNRLVYWFWFSLLLSLTPLGYSVWKLFTQQVTKDWWMATQLALSHGELILICIPLLGGAIGEMLKSSKSSGPVKITITGIAVILFFFASSTFVDISTLAALGKTKGTNDILFTSIAIFMGTLMVGSASIVISKKDRLLFGGYNG